MRVIIVPSRPSPRAGFTLLEIMVVVVILSIIATMAVGRLTGTVKREFRLATDQVADMLVMYAQRESVGQRPVALQLDTQRRALQLMVLEPDPDDPDEPPSWQIDRFVKPVKFSDVVDLQAFTVHADFESVDIRDWPLTQMPGEARPDLRITMRSRDNEHMTILALTPQAIAPVREDDWYEGAMLDVRAPIDLDEAGRSREDW